LTNNLMKWEYFPKFLEIFDRKADKNPKKVVIACNRKKGKEWNFDFSFY